MVLVIISCLFVFLGMYIGKKNDLKKSSIHMLFGLFLINSLCAILVNGYSFLSINYHSSTYYFVTLGSILGFVLMKIIDTKCEETDDISICGFVITNTIILLASKFNLLFLVVNILYYVIIGIYIKNSNSWISVFIGMVLGIVLYSLHTWLIGYVFTISFGFIIYFIYSLYTMIFKSGDKESYYYLIAGMVVALLGCVL